MKLIAPQMSFPTQQTFNLQTLMSASKGIQQDNTEYIKRHKASQSIRVDMERMNALKSQYSIAQQNEESFVELCRNECAYLFNQQPGIFYRLFKNELNTDLLAKVLETLQQIEDGKMTQHDASVNIGQMVADLYTDSALRVASNLEASIPISETPKPIVPVVSISWKDFKKIPKLPILPKQ